MEYSSRRTQAVTTVRLCEVRTEWSGVLQQEDTGSNNSEVMQGEDGVEWSTPAGGHRQ